MFYPSSCTIPYLPSTS